MALNTGARLGPYEIVAPLGAGGMGEVFTARDTRLDRTVAIKVVARSALDPSSPSRIERFRQEARAIGRLAHPNICTLHDIGEEGSLVFLVMEHVTGQTLAYRMDAGPLPIKTALSIAVQMADALDYAHRQGVIHRDLKPSNVMLTRDAAKLLDFGLAKLTQRDERARATAETVDAALTSEGTIVGTAPYMSPEQIQGREIDARSDLFSFGIVLYEMVASCRPFEGESRAHLMAAIVAQDPVPLTRRQLVMPPGLERIVDRCLAKDPDDRWQTARDLAAALRWTAAGALASDPTTSAVAVKSRRLLWGGLSGATLVGLGAAAAWMLPSGGEPQVESFSAVTFRRGVVTSARFTPDGQSIVYGAGWEGQLHDVHLARAGTPDARSLGLESARVLSVSRTGELGVLFGTQLIDRGFGVLARVPLAGGARRDLIDRVVAADWIPGTDTLAVIREGAAGEPWHVEFPLGKTVHQARAAWSIRVSPDGKRVAFFDGPAHFDSAPEAVVTVIDAAGRRSTVTEGWAGLGLAWSPNGREIWFTATRGQTPPSLQAVSLDGTHREVYAAPDWLVLHDISTERRVLLARNSIRMSISCQRAGEDVERDLSWMIGGMVRDLSSDGQTVLFQEVLGRSTTGQITVFRRGLDGSPAIRLGEGTAQAFSPDGQSVLLAVDEGWVVLPTGAGSPKSLPRGAVRRVGAGGWLPDGRQIVFTGNDNDDNTRSRIFVQDIDGGIPRAISPERVALVAKAPSFDGRSVLGYSNGVYQLYPLAGGSSEPVPGLSPRDRVLQWAADGRSLYVAAGPARSSLEIFVVNLATASRKLWRRLGPSDSVGVDSIYLPAIVRDGSAYCYTYQRRLGDLFVVDGLR